MADQPTPPRTSNKQLINEGAIPRMGMSIPIPASTKPPAAPPASGQQSSSTAKPKEQK
jgi:hypothetical protein